MRPVVQVDRVGQLASQIVKELAAGRHRAIVSEPAPARPAFKPTAAMRALRTEHRRLRARWKAVERRLRHLGAVVDYAGRLSAANGQADRERHEARTRKAKAARLARLADLRASTLVSLIGAPKAQAQRIVQTFQRKVGRI